MNGTVYALYFSPTHTSRAVSHRVAQSLAEALSLPFGEIDLTPPAARGKTYTFAAEDTVVFGFPVYGGRIPALLEDTLSLIEGNGAAAVPVAVYGNRAAEDALAEAADWLEARQMAVIAAGSFIGEHSYTAKVGHARPDESDLSQAAAFGAAIAEKLGRGDRSPVAVPGNRPYKDRAPASPGAPVTADTCTKCGLCVTGCPMGVINRDDPAKIAPGCIKCCACVKVCPLGAKSFKDARVTAITKMLELTCKKPKAPAWFV